MLSFIKASKEDIFTIQHLARTIWFSHYPGIISEEQIEYMLNVMYSAETIAKEIQEGFYWYVAMVESQPVGFISFHFEKFHGNIKLEKLYILPSFHGNGNGQKALEFIKKNSKELGAKVLTLRVNKQNEKAIKAYLKSGFLKDYEDVANIGNGYVMDDFIMSIKL